MNLRRKEAITGILLVLPFLIGFLIFYIVPFGIRIRYYTISAIIVTRMTWLLFTAWEPHKRKNIDR